MRQAEQAVEAAPEDAVAHFALFCALGERMRARGVSVRSLLELRRLRRAVDRSLELDPDYADGLHGKGVLLLDSPPLFGRDREEAERLLRRAVELEPWWVGARLDLARALAARGERAAATAEARRALAQARANGDVADVASAEKVLGELAP